MEFQRVLDSGQMERAIRELWRETRERPIRRPRHLWRLWRLHREFDFSPPDKERWSWRFPRGRVPACARCEDNCCRGPRNTVLLRLVDVARFVDRGWTEHFTLEKPQFSEELLAEKPRLREMTESFHWRVFPVLKQTQSQVCTFLSTEGKCTIHSDRPWVCRTFPYMLEIGDEAIDWSGRCEWFEDGPTSGPVVREMEQAIFHNFYTEKIRELILLEVYREELERTGVTRWLNLERE